MAFLSVGFPGLGLERFSVRRNLFSLEFFSLSLYGALIAAGFLLAVVYCMRRAGEFHLSQDEIIDMLICAVPAAVVGARLFYCVFNWSYYSRNLLRVFYVWEGGLAIYGAVIGALTAAGLYCRVKRIHIGAMFDLGALGLLIGQAVGRWGNLFNVEVYGVSTSLPWRMAIYETASPYAVYNPPIMVHPLFLYESLWNALGFVLLHFLSKKARRFNGQIFLCYAAWYGIGRGFMEGLRDPEYILDMFGDAVMVNQVLAFVSGMAALLALGYLLIFRNHDPDRMAAWTAARDARIAAKAGEKAGAAPKDGEDGDGNGTGNLADIDPEDYTPRSLGGGEDDTDDEKEGADDGGSDGRDGGGEDGQG
ncbi:MAG: prolipoprotein diacylglyceryl transferase [Oscillospiraceae bacterium]|nr:prolipoprotein diacylglyceryl transferase [Oscillospiraceae bacterium]